MTTHYIPVGTSEPQDFALVNEGAAILGAGITVELEIAQRVNGADVAVVDPPAVTWLNESAGTVRVTGTEGLELGTYLVRFKLTDTAGEVGFVPNRLRALIWQVVPVFG